MAHATIRDIAKDAGVSTATVSRVLNHSTGVTPQTEAKVRNAISRLNRQPAAKKREKPKGRNLIGLVISDVSTHFGINLIKVISAKAREAGYSLLVAITDEDPVKEREHLTMMRNNHAAGIILNTTGGNDALICDMSHKTPMVLMNRRIRGSSLSCDFIDTDNRTGAAMMTQYLIERGHSLIGVINGNTTVSSGKERAAGFFAAMKELGTDSRESYPLQYEGDYSERTGQYGARYLMEQTPRPTAVVAMNDLIMAGALKYFAAHNIRVPEDISVIGYGDINNSALFHVRPCHITQNAISSGEKAMEYLLERIRTPQLTNREVIFTSSVIEGNSVRPLL